jgi:hypothetical protein
MYHVAPSYFYVVNHTWQFFHYGCSLWLIYYQYFEYSALSICAGYGLQLMESSMTTLSILRVVVTK